MAKKGSFSKVYDKNGDYVDVEAARFDGTRTFQMQGDVTASQTWNGDPSSPLTLNASIGAKKVTTDKINDKAVQTGQIDDGAVGLTQIATAAMNGTVQDNDSKLATHAAVKTYVDAQISGQGTYLGKHTVAEINAMVTDNLHNGDRVMTSNSGTINLGPGGVGFDVETGEDLILYKSGSTVQWDSMDGNFKTKQTAVADPTASGTGLTFIDSISQDENGEITPSKKTVQDGTTSQKGVVQLEDSHSSTSTTKAATPKNVKEAYDLANTANTGAVKNVAYDSTNKKITKTINGTTTDVVSVATLKTDMALNNVDNTSDANKPVSTAQQAALDLKLDKTGDGKDVTATFTEASTRANIGTGEKLSVIFGKIKKWFTDLGTAAFKNVPASGNASSTEVVLGSDTRLSAGASAVQDVTVDGASVVNSSTKVAAVPNASTSAKGAVQLAGSIGATVASENNKAATEKAVRDAINALDAEVTSNDGTNVRFKVTEADGKVSAVNVTTDNTENKNNKVSSWQTTPDNTHYPSEKLVKDGLDAKADANKVVAIADASASRNGQSGGGWYKIASRTLASSKANSNSIWDIYSTTSEEKYVGSLDICLRFDTSGTAPIIKSNKAYTDKWLANEFPIKLVTTGLTGSLTIEVWAKVGVNYGSVYFAERNTSSYILSSQAYIAEKDKWTYYSYFSNGGESEPQSDVSTNTVATPVDFVTRQHAIASPTNNNLVAMDANGLVKDSGLTKASVESAIASAGSAIQGVKVNNTTLTPDANKIVNVPLATTSADGAMSAADKTKLNGIAEGAEVNVQADWDETYSSSDAFIKNKPFYSKSIGGTAAIFKVCLFPTYGSSATSSGSGIDVQFRYGNGSVFGRLSYKNGFKLTLTKISELATSRYVRFFYVVGDVVEIYAQTTNSYLEFKAAPSMNMPKTSVNFTNFGTVVSALPEGATEITPVWVANAASSSGTAPVKVDAYGALTPVPMDSTPTASSTNLMTSGDIKTALDTWTASGVKPDSLVSAYVDLSFSGVSWSDFAGTGTNSLFAKIPWDSNSSKSAHIYGIITGKPNDWVSHVGTNGTTVYGLFVAHKSRDSYFVDVYPNEKDNPNTSGTAVVLFELKSSVGIVTISKRVTARGAGDIGSASVPVFVNAAGMVRTCTDDFVHDGDVTSTYSATGTDPVNGTAVAAAINAVTLSQLNGKLLTSSDDIDTLVLPVGNNYAATEKWYYTRSSEGLPQHMPEDATTAAIRLIASNAGADRTIQFVYPAAYPFFFTRYKTSTGWKRWEKVYFAPTSSFSPTGAESVRAVNGAAVAAALATSLTDVEYVAAQSGGGGNLNKTKNGSTTSVLAFMTTAEARSVWTNAKAAVANAS